MSKQTHTPGPWQFIEGDRELGAMSDIMATDDFRIGYVLCESRSEPVRKEDIANGRLIAAAPELLEGAELAARQLREHLIVASPWGMALVERLEAIIVKAKGETP